MGDGTKFGHLSELAKEDYADDVGASPFVLADLIIFNMPVFTFISLSRIGTVRVRIQFPIPVCKSVRRYTCNACLAWYEHTLAMLAIPEGPRQAA